MEARHSLGRLPRRRRHRCRRPDVLRALPDDWHPRRQRGLPDADHQRLLLRWQAQDRNLLDPGPREHKPRADPGVDAGRRRRCRGPYVLHEPWDRLQGHRPRRTQQRDERLDPGRLDDHAAVRQDPLPDTGAHSQAQGQGGRPLDQDPQPAVQVRDPRGLPQHHLLRQRCLWRRDRLRDLLRQGRCEAHGPGVGSAGDDHQQPHLLRPLLRGWQGPHGPALQLRHRRHGQVGHARCRRRGEVPGQAAEVREEEGRQPLQRHQGLPAQHGREADARPGVHRHPDQRRRPQDRHHL